MSAIREILKRIFTLRWIAIAAAMFIVFLFIVLLFDQVIMPWYTKHGEALAVPNTVAKRYEEAKELLEMRGLKVIKAGEIHDANLPFGYVVDQNPRPNRLVKKGRRVYLTISAGEREIQVPELIGLSENNAIERLKSVGLRVGDIEYEYVPNEPANVVIEQFPSAQKLISSSKPIDFIVSLGAPTQNVSVPSLFGKTLDTAKREIQRAGLKVGEITYKVNNNFLPNTILNQTPQPGDDVAFGDKIDLLVTTVSERNQ